MNYKYEDMKICLHGGNYYYRLVVKNIIEGADMPRADIDINFVYIEHLYNKLLELKLRELNQKRKEFKFSFLLIEDSTHDNYRIDLEVFMNPNFRGQLAEKYYIETVQENIQKIQKFALDTCNEEAKKLDELDDLAPKIFEMMNK